MRLLLYHHFWLIFLECTVSDDNLGKSYPIINNQCPDTFLSVEANAQMSGATQTGIGFSYLGFQFVESADDDAAVNMRLTCSVCILLCIEVFELNHKN